MTHAVIIAARRTPVMPRDGAFAACDIHDLAAPVIRVVLEDARLAPQDVGELILSNALGAGGNPARRAALAAGLPQSVAGLTIDRQCCGGLDAILLAQAMVTSGQHDVVIAGGAESYSRRPLRSRTFVDGRPPDPYDQAPFTPWADKDPDMADDIQAVMESEGVKFHLGATVENASAAGDKKSVALKLGDGAAVVLTADAVLVALGRSINVKDLWLDAAGVTFDRAGITVDARLRTSRKHIFAAGDVSGGYQFTHAAGYEGGIVVSNAVFHLPRKVNYTWLPWCTYTDPELASIGLNERAAIDAGLDYSVWTEAFQDNDRGLAEGQTEGRIKLILDKKE